MLLEKDEDFIDSRQWIGAFEVSVCLRAWLGVESTVLNFESGAAIARDARRLATHFATSGTPVMVSGGALAYTLLGVDWNERSGATRFLILDPHYTGKENLQQIKNKGWCNWFPPTLFKEDAFYSLLLPPPLLPSSSNSNKP